MPAARGQLRQRFAKLDAGMAVGMLRRWPLISAGASGLGSKESMWSSARIHRTMTESAVALELDEGDATQ